MLLFSVSVYSQKTSKPNNNPLTVPSDFKSDGCTSFPDGDYFECCVEHDKAYYAGGSWIARWRADKKLYKCVSAKGGFKHKFIAPVMWAGVRVFGAPFLPTSFRWGFGKDEIRKNKLKKNSPPEQNLSTNKDKK